MKLFISTAITTLFNILFLLVLSAVFSLVSEKHMSTFMLCMVLGLIAELVLLLINLAILQWQRMRYYMLVYELLVVLLIFRFSAESLFCLLLTMANFAAIAWVSNRKASM